MMNEKLVRLSDAISAVLEDKISGPQLEIIRALGSGIQAETLNQACDRHAQYIRDLPTVDAVEVVRCRKCANWEKDWKPIGFDPNNPRYFCAEIDLFPTGDWFCADGKRREDGKV